MTLQLYDLVGRDKTRPFSPHCWKVKMALAHKGLAFETVPTTFLEVPDIENGFGKIIPVLRDGDYVIKDSFDIALYLEDKYHDRPSLFGGEGGKALARFIEGWSQTKIHPTIATVAVEEIAQMLDKADQDYFIPDREQKFGKSLSEVTKTRNKWLEDFPDKLKPLGYMLRSQKFFGGDQPLFADYIIFGAFQWARICSKMQILPTDDPVAIWFDQMLDLYDGLGRSIPAASE